MNSLKISASHNICHTSSVSHRFSFSTSHQKNVWNLELAQRGFILLAGSNDIQKHTLTPLTHINTLQQPASTDYSPNYPPSSNYPIIKPLAVSHHINMVPPTCQFVQCQDATGRDFSACNLTERSIMQGKTVLFLAPDKQIIHFQTGFNSCFFFSVRKSPAVYS